MVDCVIDNLRLPIPRGGTQTPGGVPPIGSRRSTKRNAIYERRRGFMDNATFNAIRRALHPDSRQSISDKKIGEAFDAFMALEKYILNEKEPDQFEYPTAARYQATRRSGTRGGMLPGRQNGLPADRQSGHASASPGNWRPPLRSHQRIGLRCRHSSVAAITFNLLTRSRLQAVSVSL